MLRVSGPLYGGVVLYPPGSCMGPRLQTEFEFVHMLRGALLLQSGEVTWHAPENSLVLCRPGEWYTFHWCHASAIRHSFVHFHILDAPPEWGPVNSWPMIRLATVGSLPAVCMRRLAMPEPDADPDTQLRILAALTSDFMTSTKARNRQPPEPLIRALDALSTALALEPSARLSLAGLSAAAGVTPEHLCRLFQQELGVSPSRAVYLARLDMAAALLSRSNQTITQIAYFCGFASPGHFTRRFRHAFGMTPTEARATQAPLPRLAHWVELG